MAIVRLSQYLDRPISYRSIHEACIDYANTSFITATGGTLSTYEDYIIHTFKTSDTFTITSGYSPVEILLVGGGGGGGHTSGGGGGGGQVISPSQTLGVSSYSVVIGVGGGGATNGIAAGYTGGVTKFNGLSAFGGGGGGSDYNPGGAGYTGGGGGQGGALGGVGTGGKNGGAGSGDWNNKGCGGGGGGMGAAGAAGAAGVAGKGGEGISSTITSSSVVYGSGGGGGASSYGGGVANVGGTNGGTGYKNAAGGAAVVGTGSGGGGGGYTGTTGQWKGGDGSSGIVIIRYKYDTSIPIPLMLSGCQLWFDANDGPKDGSGNTPSSGGSITTWLDRSGNNRHAVVGSSPVYTTNVLNSKPVVRFASSQYLTVSSYSPGNVPMTYVMVERNLSGSTGAAPFSWGSTSSRNSGIVFQNNSGMQPFSSQAFNNTGGRYWIYRQNNTGSGDNGLMNGTSLTPTANDTGNIASPFDIGRRNVSGIYCAGDLAEIIVYNRAITDNERSLLASYLHNKYAL